MSRQVRHSDAQIRQTADIRSESLRLPDAFPFRATPWESRSRDLDWVHHHDGLEIGICRSGAGRFFLADRLLPYRAGDIVVAGRQVLHRDRTASADGSRWLYLHLDPARLLGAMPDAAVLGTADLAQVVPAEDPAGRILHELGREAERGAAADRQVVRGLVLAALARLVGRAATSPHAAPDRLSPALSLIAARSDGPLPIPALARACGMSVSGFRTACVDTLGMPPLAYLRRFRIHRAAQRLRHERATILSIAFAAGFGSISQFDRAFRDVMGVSPRAFRAASGRSATSAPRDGSPPPG